MNNKYFNYSIYDLFMELGHGAFDKPLNEAELRSALENYEAYYRFFNKSFDPDILNAIKRELNEINNIGLDEYNARYFYADKRTYKLDRNAPKGKVIKLKIAALALAAIAALTGGIVLYKHLGNKKEAQERKPAYSTEIQAENQAPEYEAITYTIGAGDYNLDIVAEKLGLKRSEVRLGKGETFHNPVTGQKVTLYVPADFAKQYNYGHEKNDEIIFVYKLEPGHSLDEILDFAKTKYSAIFSDKYPGRFPVEVFAEDLKRDNPTLFGDSVDQFLPGNYRIHANITKSDRDNKYNMIPYFVDGEIQGYLVDNSIVSVDEFNNNDTYSDGEESKVLG